LDKVNVALTDAVVCGITSRVYVPVLGSAGRSKLLPLLNDFDGIKSVPCGVNTFSVAEVPEGVKIAVFIPNPKFCPCAPSNSTMAILPADPVLMVVELPSTVIRAVAPTCAAV
jgi:hypothetical protein